MKHTILRLFTISTLSLVCFTTTQCVIVDPAAAGNSSVGGASPPSASVQSGYGAGYEKGFADGRGGLSRTPDRYSYIYSQADRSDFFRGYEDGYNKGIR